MSYANDRQPGREMDRRDAAGAVIVTGASGLLGTPICERLAGDGYRVFGLDRAEAPHPHPAAEAVPLDVTSDDSVTEALRTVRTRLGGGDRLASVVHLAAYYDFAGEPSPLYEQVTVRGTERLLRGLRDAFAAIEQFVFSSTMLVHAPCELGERIDEDWPIQPAWDYPRSKVETEAVIRRERGAIPAVLLRIAGVYTDRCDSIPLAHEIQRIDERRLTSKVFPGNTFHGQAFVHRDDVADAVARTVARRSALPPEIAVLIGEEETLSYDELQQTFARLLHGEPSWETVSIPEVVAQVGAWVQDLPLVERITGEQPFIKPWMIPRADDHYALDITRARTLLGWEPRHRLRDALPKMVAALRADPAGWYRAHDLGDPPAGGNAVEDEARVAVAGATRK
jgi:nucleoside-diphosphate-sugar epimerase